MYIYMNTMWIFALYMATGSTRPVSVDFSTKSRCGYRPVKFQAPVGTSPAFALAPAPKHVAAPAAGADPVCESDF